MDMNTGNIPKYPAKEPTENNSAPTEDIKKTDSIKKPVGQVGKTTDPLMENVANESETDVEEIVIRDEAEAVESIVEFSKKYKFEGRIIESIDLSSLEDLSQKSARTIEKTYKKLAKGNVSVQPELTDEYAIAVASYLTELPVEFFEHLRHRDIIKIRNRVINFTFGD